PGEHLDPVVPLVGQSYVDVLRSRLADAGYDVSLLTQGPDAEPPHVGPPVYGQLPVGPTAAASALGSPAVPPWLSQLNLGPPLLQRIPLDTIDVVMPPSALWGAARAAKVLNVLVPELQEPDVSLAAAHLDAITRPVAGQIPRVDEVAARLDAEQPTADALLSR